jgi:pyridinium-3,5-bisthiocarboxylic acid mononucleotide nickel chelatase
MKTAYLDAFSGISGDMLVGAILDCGVEFDALEKVIDSLPISGYRLSAGRKTVNGISAVKFDVEVLEPQPERRLGEIRAMIDAAGGLSSDVRRKATAVFSAMAEAEAKIHCTTPEGVHFHEVGAVDSIIDIVGAVWGLGRLGVTELSVSALPMGSGFVRSRHGAIPVPAPATAELLAGFAVRLGDGEAEMVTPTGAAILKAIARPAVAGATMEIERVGYGAGTRVLRDRPNVLRLILGREGGALEADEMVEIAANIDDLNPQIYDHVSERLFAAGARDVTITPTIMKKGRPGVILSVIAEAGRRADIAAVLFAETSTIGLRSHPVSRLKLKRETVTVETRWGAVRVKVSGRRTAGALTVSPEYEDCRRAALEHGVALKLVMEEAIAAARRQLETDG